MIPAYKARPSGELSSKARLRGFGKESEAERARKTKKLTQKRQLFCFF